jgi:hydroxymethylbilane synthase
VTPLRIGTRGSQLALWQANTVARLIADRTRTICELVIIRTSGDEQTGSGPPDPPAAPINVKATFVKEIEDALLERRIDVAVHSGKDLAAEFPEGLVISAVLAREDPRDAVLLPHGASALDIDAVTRRLGAKPRIGTSSVRRAAQLGALFPGAEFVPLRGNVDTRLRKLDAGECDAAVLACAGLKRLGLSTRISLALPLDVMVPAPGQGIVSIQTRGDRPDIATLLRVVNDNDAMDALVAERAIVRALGGGCQMPLGAYAEISGDDLALTAVVTAPDGSRVIRDHAHGHREDAASIGASLANALLKHGAREIIGA